jgi:predicted site-specific integrase-resolvase
MNIDIKRLITANNYAKEQSVTTMTVYRWLKMGLVKGVEVDGVKFVIKGNPAKKQG